MKSKRPEKSPDPLTWKSILSFGMFGLVLCCLPVLAYFTFDHPWILMVLSFFYIVTAFVLRSRLIVSTLIGIFVGLVFGASNTPRDSNVPSWIGGLVVGVLIGILAGLAWDRVDADEDEPEPRKPKRRR